MKRIFILLILTASYWMLCSAVYTTQRRVALVVGTGDYDLVKNGLGKLSATEDTRRLADVLQKAGWEVVVLNGQQVTSANILRLLGLKKSQGHYSIPDTAADDFLNGQSLSGTDEILFFWGGHGVTGRDGADCIVPLDAIFKEGICQNDTALISLEWIKRALIKKGAKSVFLFVDACREDVSSRSAGSVPPHFTRSAKALIQVVVAETESPGRAGVLLVKSTQPGMYAHEMQSAGSGVFTHFFTTLLTDANEQDAADTDPADGILSVGELVNYLDFHTQDFVRNLPPTQKRGEQAPAAYWENIRENQVFLNIVTKRLTKPGYYFKTKRFHKLLRPTQYLAPVDVLPGSQNNEFFDAEVEDGARHIRVSFDARFSSVFALWQNDSDGFVFSAANKHPHIFDEYRDGFTPFRFYFPPYMLKTLVKSKGKKFYFSDKAYPHYLNRPAISGYCDYKVSEDYYTIQIHGVKRMVKAWKIRQTLRGGNNEACSPLVVKADRVYWVLQNEADSLILAMEAYSHTYVDIDKIDAQYASLCRRPQPSVDFERIEIEGVFAKK